MVYRGTYALLLALHLITVVFLVGPAAVAAMTSPRLLRARDAAGLRTASRTTRVYTLGTVAVVLLGSALVGVSGDGTAQWSMGMLWISASWVLWLVGVVLVLLLVVPAQESAASALEAGDDAGGAAGRIAAGAGLAALAWAAVVVLMVVKPGA